MPTEHDTARADRLLHQMHRVFSHDLPNQMVALQGLVQMLERDEAERISPESLETIHRLQRVARKTRAMVRFLRELGRLHAYQRQIRDTRLSVLVRELKIELCQHVPQRLPEWQLAGDAPSVHADGRRLVEAMVELLRCLLERRAGSPVALRLDGMAMGAHTELRVQLAWPAGEAPPVERQRARLHDCLELVLAQELLAAWGANLAQVEEAPTQSSFRILVPNPVVPNPVVPNPVANAHG